MRYPPGSTVWHAHAGMQRIAADAPASPPVHPLQLYFALFAALVGWFLLYSEPRKRYDGQVLLVFLAVHETGKFLLEFLRDGKAPYVQPLSAAFALLAVLALTARFTRDTAARRATLA